MELGRWELGDEFGVSKQGCSQTSGVWSFGESMSEAGGLSMSSDQANRWKV
jgi:hypothetical protein